VPVPDGGGGVINLLFISHSSDVGGSEHDLLFLLTHLDHQEFRSLVVCPREGYLTQELDRIKVPWLKYHLPWWLRGPCAVPPHYLLGQSWEGDLTRLSPAEFFQLTEEAAFSRLRWLVELIRTHGIQVVHTNCYVTLEGALAARMAGVPHLWHLHEVDVGHPGLSPRLPAVARYGLLDALSDAVVVVSEYSREFFAPWVAPERLHLIYNMPESPYGHLSPEDPRRLELRRQVRAELGLGPHHQVICSVGNAFPVKGWVHLVEAAALVAAARPEVRLVLVGNTDMPYFDRIKEAVARRGLMGIITFTGVREDAQRLMLAADLVCQPSLWESLSLVAIEAASLSLPVVATRCGGTHEVVRHGESGLLVPVGDSRALAAALTVLLDQPLLRRDFGAAARRIYLEKFTLQDYIGAFTRLYHELAARGRPAPAAEPHTLALMASLYGALLGSVVHTENCLQRLQEIRNSLKPPLTALLRRLQQLLGRMRQKPGEKGGGAVS
jgi:glycosyltransferase involved in cell wall biosynthesis